MRNFDGPVLKSMFEPPLPPNIYILPNTNGLFFFFSFSPFCGYQIQIWLAMAYEANNRHADCIALYQQLEKRHPSVSIRRQAANLRYILQAPKLKISQEEMVTIPLIGSSYDRYMLLAFWIGYKIMQQ